MIKNLFLKRSLCLHAASYFAKAPRKGITRQLNTNTIPCVRTHPPSQITRKAIYLNSCNKLFYRSCLSMLAEMRNVCKYCNSFDESTDLLLSTTDYRIFYSPFQFFSSCTLQLRFVHSGLQPTDSFFLGAMSVDVHRLGLRHTLFPTSCRSARSTQVPWLLMASPVRKYLHAVFKVKHLSAKLSVTNAIQWQHRLFHDSFVEDGFLLSRCLRSCDLMTSQ